MATTTSSSSSSSSSSPSTPTTTFHPAITPVDPNLTPTIAQPVCLVAIDGWGISPVASHLDQGNAILHAKTPVMTDFATNHPYTVLAAHGLSVGLPDGLMGNSEVGHLNLGAGRVVYQDIVRIDLAVQHQTLLQLPAIHHAFEHAKLGKGRLHFLGLVSDGGVHSHQNHLYALIKEAKAFGIPECYVHFFADGRDTAPKSAVIYLRDLLRFMKELNYGHVATVMGRYYAMDRDQRWERLEIALKALLFNEGERVEVGSKEGEIDPMDFVSRLEKRYQAGETDEFLKPMIFNPQGQLKAHDTLFFFNYRSDRMRQLIASFLPSLPLSPLATSLSFPESLHCTTMTSYKAEFPFPVAFPPQTMDNVLSEWLAKHHVPQCHVAETEKYAHVTFFFNGGCEKQFPGEERVLISSPKVATYDLKPEMSSLEVGQAVAQVVRTKKYPFVMCNFAPPDMVGHTGHFAPAVKAVEATDQAIGLIYEACQEQGYVLLVTADHGNVEKMLDEVTGQPHTAHTTAPVPLCMVGSRSVTSFLTLPLQPPALCDVAPTILQLMGLPIPKEMDGQSLLKVAT
ncbi:hypothetical protein HMI54_011493 [Coelomomyces lativittatus]|nr:hypothetical protein HMI55_007358 [Coelomomyces lativittatus]KAJ1509575.1 hypothetical protein HMI56_006723 [Coelomomyces lativittatus]KAJ1515856.1 hypothetical protein HMI54_011493 [Coelomomyces lativittatus]